MEPHITTPDPHELENPVFEHDAYNSVGEHLRNDPEQSQRSMVATVLAGLGSAALVLWVIL